MYTWSRLVINGFKCKFFPLEYLGIFFSFFPISWEIIIMEVFFFHPLPLLCLSYHFSSCPILLEAWEQLHNNSYYHTKSTICVPFRSLLFYLFLSLLPFLPAALWTTLGIIYNTEGNNYLNIWPTDYSRDWLACD